MTGTGSRRKRPITVTITVTVDPDRWAEEDGIQVDDVRETRANVQSYLRESIQGLYLVSESGAEVTNQ